MDWKWTSKGPPILIYCKLLVKCSYRGVFEKLTDHLFKVLYLTIFKEEAPYMYGEAMSAVSKVSY